MWHRRERMLGRGRPFRERRPAILIVCEGEKTEPNYFSALRMERRLSSARIEIVPGTIPGSDPRRIVNYALYRIRQRRHEGEKFDHVWCVFDRDEHPKINEAFAAARRAKIAVAYSNPCFELWYLIHFEPPAGPMHRDVVWQRLVRHLPHYHKSSTVYDELLPLQGEALRRAHELREQLERHGKNPTDNPSTYVDRLVQWLNEMSPLAKGEASDAADGGLVEA